MLKLNAFKPGTINAAMSQSIENDAQNGRISHAFLSLVTADYGLTLPSSPRQFIATLNREYFAADVTAPVKLAPLAQSLHEVATVLHQSGKVNGLATPLPLPAWADPVAIAAKKAETAAKRKATMASKAADGAADGTAPQAIPDKSAIINAIVALIGAGLITGDDWAMLENARTAYGATLAPV